MTINNVLLFPNRAGRVTEADISAVESELDRLGIEHMRFSEGEDHSGADAVISLGGDGTMLSAAHAAISLDVPLLGINFGTLGYMSGLESGELELLSALKGGFSINERMMIDLRVMRGGRTAAGYTALNEAVINRDPRAGIARLELLCDGTTVCGYRSDGVIIATPTGSSAYALSAGGPIIDTKLDAFCVCPICPHAMGTRPMVFSPNSRLSIVNGSESGANLLAADGRHIAVLENGDIVEASRSDKTIKLITVKKDAFYEVLHRKMI